MRVVEGEEEHKNPGSLNHLGRLRTFPLSGTDDVVE